MIIRGRMATAEETRSGTGCTARRNRGGCLLAIGCLSLLLVSCERAADNSGTSQTASTSETESPTVVIERLIDARSRGAYAAFSELVIPEQREKVVSLLMAVDEFLHANDALCRYVRDEISLGLAETIDHGHWGARLEVFSRYVQLINETIDGDQAQVAYMIDQRLPVRYAELVRRDGRWLYDPGDGYDERLPEAFRRMARGLRDVREDLVRGRMTQEELRDKRSVCSKRFGCGSRPAS